MLEPLLVVGFFALFVFARRDAIAHMLGANGSGGEEGPLNAAEAARPGVVVTEILMAALVVFTVSRLDGTPDLLRFVGAAVALLVGAFFVLPGRGTNRPAPWLGWARAVLGVTDPSARRRRRRRRPSDPFDERLLLDRLLKFRDTEIEAVMVPRIDMIAIDKHAGVDALLALVEEHRHSRYPVYETDIDRVVEVVNVFDLLSLPPGTQSFESIVRDALVVPETKHCDDLLEKMVTSDREFAIAVDEYGGTAGLVTREDLIEELVGEIWDEHEQESVTIRRVGKDAYVAKAVATVEEVTTNTGLELPDGDYETLAGFLLDQFGRIPVRGDTVRYGSATFEVLVADRRKIDSVQITLDRAGGLS